MKRFFPLFILCAAPFFGQDLPPLAPVPSAPLPAQTASQPEQNTQVLEAPRAMPSAPVPSVPNTELEKAAKVVRPSIVARPAQKSTPKKEITYSEYKAARKLLYKQMRASESVFRRTGAWFDLSFTSFDFSLVDYYSYYDNEHYDFFSYPGLSLSFGRVLKGFMSGVSFQYTFNESYKIGRRNYSMPSVYDIAGVIGYRIAPDNFVGMRLMLHVGYGSSFHGAAAVSPSGQSPISYVLLMPELKIDLKVYKYLVLTLGLAYKGTIFVQDSRNYASALQSELGFNGLRALRISLGLAVSY